MDTYVESKAGVRSWILSWTESGGFALARGLDHTGPLLRVSTLLAALQFPVVVLLAAGERIDHRWMILSLLVCMVPLAGWLRVASAQRVSLTPTKIVMTTRVFQPSASWNRDWFEVRSAYVGKFAMRGHLRRALVLSLVDGSIIPIGLPSAVADVRVQVFLRQVGVSVDDLPPPGKGRGASVGG